MGTSVSDPEPQGSNVFYRSGSGSRLENAYFTNSLVNLLSCGKRFGKFRLKNDDFMINLVNFVSWWKMLVFLFIFFSFKFD